jgi:D-sedoheptulose 7-phosphate isomerase
MRDGIHGYLSEVQDAISRIDPAEIAAFVSILFDAFLERRSVFTLGNGASAALASHMACDLGKGTAVDLGTGPRSTALQRLRILSLTDNAALMTAYSNDINYEDVFVEQLKNLLQPGDVVIGISGSGGSPNVLRAMAYAHDSGARTVGLTGSQVSSSLLAEHSDLCLCLPLHQIEQIEDLQVIVHHAVSVSLRERIATHFHSALPIRLKAQFDTNGLADAIAAND